MRNMQKHLLTAESERRGHDIIVIGGSAGGIPPLRSLLSKIPADLPAAFFVVIHTAESGRYMLPEVLQRDTALKVLSVEDKMPILYGQVYIARPNLHLLIEDEHIRVVFGPKENRTRPAIDPLFRSAASVHRSRVAGILLSGGLDDGVAGLWDIHCCGGATIVQDPHSASSPELIQYALAAMRVDHVAPPDRISRILHDLAHNASPEQRANALLEQDRIRVENNSETNPVDHAEELGKVGILSSYTCPGCGGPLWKLPTGRVDRYRCRVGHAYSSCSLFQACWETSEKSLYGALQMLEENSRIGRQLIEKGDTATNGRSQQLIEEVERLEKEAGILRDLLYERHRTGCEI
jgi:two-component system, chemotaxis family, protein-glutamate methylesterase/glutaminase